MKKTKNTLTIYLADLVHNFIPSMDNWMIPLSTLLVGSYIKAAFDKEIELTTFKFPDRLLKAIKENPPDIVGLSNYCWNFELNKTVLRFAKECNADTITVMGGPNITPSASNMTEMLKSACCDYYITGAGEHPFKCLVSAVLESRKNNSEIHKSRDIHSIWYVDPATEQTVFKQSAYTFADLDEISSPFQNGMAKEFLEQGLIPMIETQRGCPFRCTYCSWDNSAKQIYKYSMQRVKADIDCCRQQSRDERLMINDPNFGLLGERDLEIAKFIRDLNKNYGWPEKVIVNWGQVKSDIAFEAAEILKGIAILRQSSQSLNPEVLKNINRRSIPDEEWKKFALFCSSNGVESFGELIAPLPGETIGTYLSALRYFFDLGLDCINTNTLMLLEGAEINKPEEREKYKIKTGFRLMENCYGIYENRIAIEYQEMVLSTNSFSLDDFFLCRKINWLIQMSWTMRQHDLLLNLLQHFGINPVDFFIEVIRDYKKAPLAVGKVFDDFSQDAREEFFPDKEKLNSYYSLKEKMKFLRKGGFRKLNTYYSSRILLECNKEFIEYYEAVAYKLLKGKRSVPADYEKIVRECVFFLQQRYINADDLDEIEAGKDISKEIVFHYDIAGWESDGGKASFKSHYYPQGLTYKFFVEDKQSKVIKKYLQSFSGISKEYQLRKILEPYQGISRKYLLFCVERFNDETDIVKRGRYAGKT